MAEIGWCGIDWDKAPWSAEGREKVFVKMNEVIEERKLDKGMIAAAYTNRGTVFECNGELGKAIYDYTAALELDPDCELTYLKRARIYCRMKEYTQAFSDVNNAIRLNSSEEKLKINETQLLEKIKSKLSG
jgi:tetratricopeptide (TPR) repeat protein